MILWPGASSMRLYCKKDTGDDEGGGGVTLIEHNFFCFLDLMAPTWQLS